MSNFYASRDEAIEALKQAEAEYRAAADHARRAANARAQVIRKAAEADLSRREIAKILGLTSGRVQQVITQGRLGADGERSDIPSRW